ncbi:uncharacterized protein LOC128549148 isoform X2 [Mercenaria mercenaria]|uniref:uncharacterized protein LOC128549148 isoform X2 n=1 Tax=Mercenaria mercenaria TaxID=6596 RepID=UPI00234FB2BF|nr:uncharacterized protein LOC128549148 isoform X2 [Mercenaria mercenaria]
MIKQIRLTIIAVKQTKRRYKHPVTRFTASTLDVRDREVTLSSVSALCVLVLVQPVSLIHNWASYLNTSQPQYRSVVVVLRTRTAECKLESSDFLLIKNMDFPTFCEPVSLCLSEVLEALGVNERTVNKRRELYHQAEVIREMGFHLTSKICNIPTFSDTKIYHFGSKIEGSTTLGLKSDVDLVYCTPKLITVIESISEKSGSIKDVLIVKNDATPYGHCRLRIVNIDGKRFQSKDMYYYDSNGSNFLPNTYLEDGSEDFTSKLMPRLRHGPSSYYMNTDNIMAINLPPALSMTTKNVNCFNWPAKALTDKLRKAGGLLVPIGHSQSENAHIEWRISYSFAERLLIFDFNITQLRCLVLLKMIKKTFLQPIVGDEFTSYHCKTTLFHTIARTRSSLWREDRLFDCLMCCFSTLQQFLSHHFCPHFFDQKVNLFIGKLTPNCCKKLSVVIEHFRNDNLRSLQQVQTDDLGARILNKTTVLGRTCFQCRELVENQMLIDIVYDRLRFLIEYSRHPYIHMYNSHPTLKKQIYAGFKLFKELMHIMKYGNDTERAVSRLFVPHFAAKHASLMSAYRMKKKQPVSENIIDLFKIGFQTDATSSRLKLASVLFSNGEISQTNTILNEVENKLSLSVLPTCFVFVFTFAFQWENFYKMASENSDVISCSHAFSLCVEFMRNDVWCCPLGLRRSLITKEKSREDIASFGVQFGKEVDSKTILYYLQFLTYARLSSQLKTKALKNLMQCVMGNSCRWLRYFFDIATREEEDIIQMYTDRVFTCQDKYLESYHEVIIPGLYDNLTVDPWGSIRLCICYALHKCSVVQHMDMALLLIGYSFEYENQKEFASAFYWMSFIVEPSSATARHILRVCPQTSVLDYFNNFYSGMTRRTYTRKLEISLLPTIVEAFAHLLEANISMGILLKPFVLRGTYKARCYICILNSLIRKYDLQEKKSPDAHIHGAVKEERQKYFESECLLL